MQSAPMPNWEIFAVWGRGILVGQSTLPISALADRLTPSKSSSADFFPQVAAKIPTIQASMSKLPGRAISLFFIAALMLGCALLIAAKRFDSKLSDESESSVNSRATTAANSDHAPAQRFPVTIRRPEGPPRVNTGVIDAEGNPVTVACSNCHAARNPNPNTRRADELDEFHQGLTLNHGQLSCLSCHNPGNYDALRLADGSEVAYVDVMQLCSQCHGPQRKDYDHGIHGGMNGYWDLTRGPRVRNNCVDCHDPHAPAFPMMKPTFKPKDRFLDSHSPEDN